MHIPSIPLAVVDWSQVPAEEHRGTTGVALWRVQRFGDIRVRMVEFTPGYVADHWCSKGHILLCVAGELHTKLADGRRFVLGPGVSYAVADGAEPHRSSTPVGARLFVVD